MAELPTGTVTFLYTDIEASTRRWEEQPQAMHAALARHDALMRGCIEDNGGYIFRTVGDAFNAAFPTAPEALQGALAAQHALSSETWSGETGPIKVRMALHTGTPLIRDGEYHGQPLNRIARLLSAGHGGQTLLSQPAYDLVRDTLPKGASLDDLGEHHLKDLVRPEHIYQLVISGLPDDFPPLKTLDNRPNNLPVQRSLLIGREKELEAVTRLLLRDDVGVLTLTGPGGTGKTRLGLQAAAELVDDFEDGVFVVQLAPISDPDLLPSAIAQPLGVKEATNRPILESLKDYLRDKQMLLLLDNFEQMVEAAPVIADLLAQAPRLKVLVTSRETLRIYGEHDFPVPPLSLPDLKHLPPIERMSQYEAVRLFIERAAAVKPSFDINNENAPAVAEICYRLDGLPLAIELAAARIVILTPQAMLARLSSTLKLLTGGARDLPVRQQTLRGAIAWSYDLLDAGEQMLFRRMSIFVGGCTLEAAEAVCNAEGDLPMDLLDGVASLVKKSLLRQIEGVDGEPRFTMLETIREYGLERLAESGEADNIRRHYAAFFLTLVEEGGSSFINRFRIARLQQFDMEYANVRLVLEWSVSEAVSNEIGLRLVGYLFWYWNFGRYFSEGRAWLNKVLACPDALDRTTLRANALFGAGFMAFLQGDYNMARLQLEESVGIWREAGEKEGLAYALHPLGMTDWAQGDYSAARDSLQESVALFRETGINFGLALALFSYGDAALGQGDDATARALYEESLALYRGLGDQWGASLPLTSLGRLAWVHGDYATARRLVEEGLAWRRENDSWLTGISLASLAEIARCEGNLAESQTLSEEALAQFKELGDSSGIAWSLQNLGFATHYGGDHGRAATFFREGLTLRKEQASKEGVVLCLVGLAEAAVGEGRHERAARLFGAAEAQLEAVGVRLSPADRSIYEVDKATVCAELTDVTFAELSQAGRAMTIEQAVAYALDGR